MKNGSKNQTQKNGRKKGSLLSRCSCGFRSPRDGRFIEEVGFYDPMKEPVEIKLDAEKIQKWIGNGAQPTDTVRALLVKSGVISK